MRAMQTSTALEQATAPSYSSPSALAADQASATAALPTEVNARKRINSKTLLAGERELEIEHAGQLYRLRVTALGKLILTK